MARDLRDRRPAQDRDNEALIDPGTELESKRSFSWYDSKDRGSVFLLLFLYVLQGVPLGISASVPMLLAVSTTFCVQL